MSEHLPEFVDPIAFADKRRRLKGRFGLAAMGRLADLLMDASGEATAEFQFERQGRHAVVAVKVKAELILRCQCCLEALRWPVDTEVALAVVSSIDEANLLPESLEPLLMEKEDIALIDLVEHELVLAVPTIPQHEQCGIAVRREDAGAEPEPGRRNPFAQLADLKKLN